jgi:hypothetical protein
MSPAMAAGVTPKLWEVSDIVALLEAAGILKSGIGDGYGEMGISTREIRKC